MFVSQRFVVVCVDIGVIHVIVVGDVSVVRPPPLVRNHSDSGSIDIRNSLPQFEGGGHDSSWRWLIHGVVILVRCCHRRRSVFYGRWGPCVPFVPVEDVWLLSSMFQSCPSSTTCMFNAIFDDMWSNFAFVVCAKCFHKWRPYMSVYFCEGMCRMFQVRLGPMAALV